MNGAPNIIAQFEVCPACGSKDRLVEKEVNMEIIAGNLPHGTRIPATVSQSLLLDTRIGAKTIIAKRQAPMLIGLYDVCGNCGCLYCVEMRSQLVVADPQTRKQSGGGNQ